jgi:hypothetical protein
LKEQFPDREVSPSDSVTAPVAAVFELIRSGNPDEARRRSTSRASSDSAMPRPV